MTESKYPPHLRKHAELAIALITRIQEINRVPNGPGLEDHEFAKTTLHDFVIDFECSYDELIMGLLQMNMVGIRALSLMLGIPTEHIVERLAIVNQEV